MKKLMVVVFLVGFLSISTDFSSPVSLNNTVTARAAESSQTVSTEDLGVKSPGILPTNPFYFLKEFRRTIQRTFTFNSVAKAQLELKITNEKAAEAKKIQEIAPNDNKAITKGLENYKGAQDKLKTSLESLNNALTTPNVAKFLNSVSDNIVLHQKVLDEIGNSASDSAEIQSKVSSAKENNNIISVVVIKDSLDGFMAKPDISTATQSVFSECDNLKISLEKITFEMKDGNLTEDQFKIKYENLKKELEKCINSKQPQPADSIVKPVEKSSNCDFLKKYPADLETMLKKGEISEKDYNSKLETIKKELEKCSSQPDLTESLKPAEQVYCTQEAKLCSDGSYVGRTGLNCEFTKCPAEDGGSSSIINFFSGAYWQCYDGKEFSAQGGSASGGKDNLSTCKTSEEWQTEAKKFCDGHCYADKSKCGVNTFNAGANCVLAPSVSSVSSSGVVIKEDCGQEKEKLNRDPLAGPVNKKCCLGLKEDRSNISYSLCIKSEESDSASTEPSVSGTNTTNIANPASVYCVKQGYKNEIRTNADGNQYGVCIFKDGSECDEWKFYKNECKEGISSTNTDSSVNTGTTNIKVSCPVFAPVSPEVVKSCSDKGGKMVTTQDANGCYLPPSCILPTTSTSSSQ